MARESRAASTEALEPPALGRSVRLLHLLLMVLKNRLAFGWVQDGNL